MYGIEELIALAAEKRASDVHLIAGLPPKCRIDGRIETLTDGGLTREDCEEYGRQLAGNAADQIEAIGQLDFSASFAGRRLRVNLFRQQGALSAAIRLLRMAKEGVITPQTAVDASQDPQELREKLAAVQY